MRISLNMHLSSYLLLCSTGFLFFQPWLTLPFNLQEYFPFNEAHINFTKVIIIS